MTSDHLTQVPNPNATEPTGMCGSPTKCSECPSTFLCMTKAQAEVPIVRKRIAEGFCPKREDKTHCEHWWDDSAPCCNCGDNSHD